MTVWVLAALALAALAWLCLWGSDVVFHPPKMLQAHVRPEDLGFPYERAAIPTPDGLTLSAWLVPAAAPTDRTVLACHGWGDNKGDILRRIQALRRDFNLFLFDSRGHGESPAPRSTIGYLESVDFAAALAFLRRERPAWAARLGAYGLSMGAAMVIHGMAKDPSIRCAVLEAPYSSFNGVVARFAWNHWRLPRFPLVELVLWTIRLRLGADPEPWSPVYHAPALAGRPTLFIAGARDRLMPLRDVEAVFAAAGGPKELWVVPEATHGRCQELAGPAYEARLREFFQAHL